MALLPRHFERLDKPHNHSAILRSCDAVEVLEAHRVSLPGSSPSMTAPAT
jgi:tRNA (guanosine-2'-O-)-methyltransferase